MASLQFKGLGDLEAAYRKAGAGLAAGEARAVKRAATTLSARQARAIAAIVALPIAVIKAKIVAIKSPTTGEPRVVFEVRGQGIALRDYGARQTKSGVSVLVLRGAGRKIVRGAFLARGYGNNLQVFKRTGQAKRRMKAGRYARTAILREPIEKLFGPDVYSQYIKDAIQKVGTDTWLERLPIELDRESEFALRRAGLL